MLDIKDDIDFKRILQPLSEKDRVTLVVKTFEQDNNKMYDWHHFCFAGTSFKKDRTEFNQMDEEKMIAIAIEILRDCNLHT